METEKVKSNDGQKEVPLDTWIEENGAPVMYTREKVINFCVDGNHQLNSNHECNRCPFVFTGFRANMHIQTQDGIFERKPAHALGKRLA